MGGPPAWTLTRLPYSTHGRTAEFGKGSYLKICVELRCHTRRTVNESGVFSLVKEADFECCFLNLVDFVGC